MQVEIGGQTLVSTFAGMVIKEDISMKIQSDAIIMSSDRKALSVDQFRVTRGIRTTRGALKASKENGGILSDVLPDEDKEEGVDAELTISTEGKKAYNVMQAYREQPSSQDIIDEYKAAIESLRAILKILKSLGGSRKAIENLERQIDKQSAMLKMHENSACKFRTPRGDFSGFSNPASARRVNDDNQVVTVRQTETFHAESEYTSFSAAGVARTADGRSISFGVEVNMSREFMSYTKVHVEDRTVLCDPLVINVGANVADVSDQKFTFDMDADGKMDSISRLGENSGYISFDRNGNGKIDDGSELFGTKSGDGFRDLAAYDRDKNGWIDENDEIFDKLKIWFQGSDGKDRLLSLKEADVGAIFLGKADTEFSVKDEETNRTEAVIRSTGVYLKESGGVGTLQHVDMAL